MSPPRHGAASRVMDCERRATWIEFSGWVEAAAAEDVGGAEREEEGPGDEVAGGAEVCILEVAADTMVLAMGVDAGEGDGGIRAVRSTTGEEGAEVLRREGGAVDEVQGGAE